MHKAMLGAPRGFVCVAEGTKLKAVPVVRDENLGKLKNLNTVSSCAGLEHFPSCALCFLESFRLQMRILYFNLSPGERESKKKKKKSTNI